MLNTYNTISLSYKVTDTKNIPPPPPERGVCGKNCIKLSISQHRTRKLRKHSCTKYKVQFKMIDDGQLIGVLHVSYLFTVVSDNFQTLITVYTTKKEFENFTPSEHETNF